MALPPEWVAQPSSWRRPSTRDVPVALLSIGGHCVTGYDLVSCRGLGSIVLDQVAIRVQGALDL
jgi:hypothetical protein